MVGANAIEVITEKKTPSYNQTPVSSLALVMIPHLVKSKVTLAR